VEHDGYDKIQRVFISAKKGIGLDLLRQIFFEFVTQNPELLNYSIPVAEIEEQYNSTLDRCEIALNHRP
jgi:GTPase